MKARRANCSEWISDPDMSSDEEDTILTPRFSLRDLQQQSQLRTQFSAFMEATRSNPGSGNQINNGVMISINSQSNHVMRSINNFGSVVVNLELYANNGNSIARNSHSPVSRNHQHNESNTDVPVTNVSKKPKIDMEDIKDEIEFWNSAITCFVIDANPLIHVMEGFVKRIWGKMGGGYCYSFG